MIKIGKLLTPKLIELNLAAKEKNAILEELIDILVKNDIITKESSAEVLKCIIERESMMSTGIGGGVAIPHGKTEVVNKLIACFGRSSYPIDFQALDKQPVNMFFVLVTPKDSSVATDHIKALARISRLLKHKYIRQLLFEAKTSEEVMGIINEADINQ